MSFDWMNKKIDPEIKKKASKCKTEEELRQLAAKNNINLTDKDITDIFNFFQKKELLGDELELVAGGSKKSEKKIKKATIKIENKNNPTQYTVDDMIPLTKEESDELLASGQDCFLNPADNTWYKLV